MLTAVFEVTTLPILLALLILWAFSAVEYYRKDAVVSWWRENWLASLVPLALTMIVLVSVESKFRILSDGPDFLAMSQYFFSKKLPLVTGQAMFTEGQFLPIDPGIPHRPLLFPMLISFVHTLVGYGIENAFYLNAFFLFLLFLLLFRIANEFFPRSIALVVPILACAQPVLTSSASSAGMDLFATLGMIYVLWIAREVLEQGSRSALHHLFLSCLVFAQIRYEGILFCLIIVGYLFYARRELFLQLPQLKQWLFVYPLLFLPSILQRVILDPVHYQAPSGKLMFGGQYLLAHTKNFLVTLIDFGFFFPYATAMNLFVLIFGLAALALRRVEILKLKELPFVKLLALVVSTHLIFMMAYFAGNPLNPMVARYFMFPVLVISFLFVPIVRVYLPALKASYYWGTAFAIFAFYHPVSVEGKFYFQLSEARVLRQEYNFLDRQNNSSRRVLIVSKDPLYHIIRQKPAVTFDFYRQSKEEIISWKEQKLIQDIYVFQFINLKTGEPLPGTSLKGSAKLSVVESHPIMKNPTDEFELRISKILD